MMFIQTAAENSPSRCRRYKRYYYYYYYYYTAL